METRFDSDAVVRRTRAGDTDAFGEIVRHYQEEVWKIVAYALKRTGATEDFVQQTFVNAFLNLDQYEEGRDFGKWIRGIARNLVCSELRRHGREEKRLKKYGEHVATLMETGRSEEEDHRLREALAECRRELPPVLAEALDLRYGEGLEFEEVARRLGRTVEATRQMLFRVRVSLRACIEKRMSRT